MLLQYHYARRYHLEVENKYPLSLHWLIYTYIPFWEGNSRIKVGTFFVKKNVYCVGATNTSTFPSCYFISLEEQPEING